MITIDFLEKYMHGSQNLIAWKDANLKYMGVGKPFLDLFGFQSEGQMIGLSDYETPAEEFGDVFSENDRLAIQSGGAVFLELTKNKQDDIMLAISNKMPLYDLQHNFKGVFSQCTLMQKSDKIKTLIEEIQANNHSSCLLMETIDQFSLSKRESECLYHLMRGKSAKHIANRLNISAKTVEFHVSNIKIKMDCHSKAELIDKCFKHRLFNFIPIGFL